MRVYSLLVALVVSGTLFAQQTKKGPDFYTPKSGTVCYAKAEDAFTNVGPPEEYTRRLQSQARTQAANIEVTYDGFTAEAQAAFQEAVNIWASIIETPVTIRIQARWTPLGAGVLGSASPGTYAANFDGAQKNGVWYPIALAEKISGTNMNGTDPDIVASFNSTNNAWHYGLTGQAPPAGKYDLVSIVLHEIGHGLGITHAYSVDSGLGIIPDYFSNRPVLFEVGLETPDGKNIINQFTPPSADLKNALTGEILYYNSPLIRAANGTFPAQVYAPATYSAGSSIAHLDEATYPAGSGNSLMTPQIGSAERILNPGPIVRAILKEMGWTAVLPKHTALKNTEDAVGPYNVVLQVKGEGNYDAGSVTVNYKVDGGSSVAAKMTPTANANEFSLSLPVGGAKYSYYISLTGDDQRVYTYPGTLLRPGIAPVQRLITFSAGPDTQGPKIVHTPKEFIAATDKLDLQAVVTDNIGVKEVFIEFKVKGVAQPDQPLTLKANTDSIYVANIDLGTLANGDKVEYRLRAKDKAVAGNVSYLPSASEFFVVNVSGLGATADSYRNNFDNLSAVDFFGNGFSITKPTGFNDGAIHSKHPYDEAGANSSINYVYTLKVPIKVKSADALLKFDEIVLVEPGEAGVVWPDANFYDYVVLEGSLDGGVTWNALGAGYDSRQNTTWLNLWNGSITNNNSTAVGEPSLYRTHVFNLLDYYKAGDEVAFRFRMFSDPFSAGWGWSIDNLRIQVDDVPPTILHKHYDYVVKGTSTLNLGLRATDAFGISQIFVDYNVNGGAVTTSEILVNPLTNDYSLTIDLGALGLNVGDEFQYKIRAIDGSTNTGMFPTSGFIKVVVIDTGASAATLSQVVSDFSTASADLTSNFFSTSQPAGFTSAGMNSDHPYSVGLGLDQVSDFVWMTKKPVKVSADNPRIYFEDIAVVEYAGAGIKDFVVVEASKDAITWDPLLDAYAATAFSQWKAIFDNGGNAVQSMIQKHMFSITTSGKFKAGDNIFIRFRLHSDATGTGWGWFVDNLSIQGPVTGLENNSFEQAVAWPNPLQGNTLNVSMTLPHATDVSVEILSSQGLTLVQDQFSASAGDVAREYAVADWADGLYVVRVRSEFGTTVRKVVKVR